MSYADFVRFKQQESNPNPAPAGSDLDPLEAAHQDVLNEKRQKNLDNRSAPVRGVLAGIDTLQAMGGGGMALVGKAVGSETLTRKGLDIYERNMEEASVNPSAVGFRDLVDDPSLDGALEWTGYTLGNLLPSMAEAAGGAVIGSLAAPGPGTAAGGLLGRTILKKGIQKLAADLAESAVAKGATREVAQSFAEKEAARAMLKSFGAKAGAVGATWQMESGGNFAEAVEQVGLDDASVGSALATGAAAALLETAGGNIRIIDKLFGTEAGKAVKKAIEKGDTHLVARIFKEATVQAPAEMLQEAGQEFLSLVNLAVNDPQFQMLTPENYWRLAESGAAGAVGGVAFGAATGMMPQRRGMQPEPVPAKPAGPLAKAVAKAPVVAPAIEPVAGAAGPIAGGMAPAGVSPTNWDARFELEAERPELNRQGGADGLSELRQEAGTAQEVPPVRGEAVELPGEEEYRRLDEVQPLPTLLDAQAHEAATSPANDRPEPTEAQQKAGNYKVGRTRLHGLDISIENPAGSTRKGTDENGRPWQTDLASHYGYIRGTVGRAKDHIDVFVRPGVDQSTAGDKVYVVDQIDPKTGKLDEHKVMLGFDSLEAARAGYLQNYDDTGPQRIGAVTEATVEEFKAWLQSGKTKSAFAGQKAEGKTAVNALADARDGYDISAGRVIQHAGESITKNQRNATLLANSEVASFEERLLAEGWAKAGNDWRKGGWSLFLRSQGPDASTIVQWQKEEVGTGGTSEKKTTKLSYPALKQQALAAGLNVSAKQKDGSFLITHKADGKEIFRAGNLAEVRDHLAGEGKAPEEKPGKSYPQSVEAAKQKEVPTAERRHDLDRRKKVAEMDPEEMRRELLISPLTGLGNRRAFEEAEAAPFVASIDVDSLKYVNDTMGHEAGDELLRQVGRALGDGYHLSGDEFAMYGKTKLELLAKMAKARKALAAATVTDGNRSVVPSFSFGIGTTMAEADKAMATDKQKREKAGQRAARGEAPPSLTVLKKRSAAQKANDEKLRRERSTINVDADDILRAISKLGGLDLNQVESQWGKTLAESARDFARRGVFGKPVFRRNGGEGLDRMTEMLAGHGYLATDENGKADIRALEQALTKAAHGEVVSSMHAQAPLNLPKMEAPPAATSTLDDPFAFDDFSDGQLEEVGYYDLASDERQAYEDLYASAVQSLGEDTTADLIDGLASRYQDESEFYPQASKALKEALDEAVQNSAGKTERPAARETREGEGSRSEIAGDETGASPQTQEVIPAKKTGEDGKLFATPSTFGKKPQTGGQSVSTSELLDNFTPDTQTDMFAEAANISAKSSTQTPDMETFELDLGMFGTFTVTPANRAPIPDGGKLIAAEIVPSKIKLSQKFADAYQMTDGKVFAYRISVVERASGERYAQAEYMGENQRQGDGIVAQYKLLPTAALESNELRSINAKVEKLWERANADKGGDLFADQVPDAGKLVAEPANTVFTEDAYQKAKALLKKKLAGQLNSGIDPELMQAGFTIAGYHIERGARKFVNYAEKMIEEFGDVIKPYLKSFYNGVRDLPGIDQITSEMDNYQTVAAYDVNDERFTPENLREQLGYEESPATESAPAPATEPNGPEKEAESGLKMSLKETTHSKKGHKLFVVTMDERVERDVYDRLNRDAKRTGNGYSSYRGHGAIPGFQFLDRQAAENFKAKWSGATAETAKPSGPELAANEVQPEDSPYIYTKEDGDWFWRHQSTKRDPLKPGNLMENVRLDFQDKLETLLAQKSEAGIMEETPREAAADDRPVAAADREDGGIGAEREGAADLPRIEDGGKAADIPGRDRTGDGGLVSASLRGSLREDSLGEEPGRVRSAGAESKPGAARNLGADQGDVSGILRSDTAGDLRVPVGGLARTGSWKATASRNLDIIELIHTLEQEKRPATVVEQQQLMLYTGWGASDIRNKLFPGYAQHGRIFVNWAEADWKPLVERVEQLLSADDLKTAARSSQYAHYTSEAVTRSIWSALQRLGFAGGKVFEPGMGTGNFMGTMPDAVYANSKYTGIEFDNLTAAIAKQLYPAQNIIHGDFTKQKFPNNFFDVAIGNPPFSQTVILADPDYKKHKFPLHDYFFAKTIDKVRPGGLLVFVTSRYTLDKQGDKARTYLAERADLIGAIRLPQTAFKQNAGTEVVTDVIFLRKRADGEASGGESWLGLDTVKIGETEKLINEYFVRHPEMVLGTHATESSAYDREAYTVKPLDGDIEQQFAEAVQNLPAGVYSVMQQSAQEVKEIVVERDFNPKHKKEGGVYLSDKGELMRVEFGSGVALGSMAKLADKDKAWLKDYVGLRDLMKQARYDQFTDGDWEKSLRELNRSYDLFVKKHGRIKEFTLSERKETDEDGNETRVEYPRFKWQRLLGLDVEGPLLEALEHITEDGEVVKAPFLKERTVVKPVRQKPQSMGDALALSLDEIGRLDLDHVARLMNLSRNETVEALGDLVFETPEGRFELADEYLSGDVVTKLAEAEAAAAADERYRRNVKALTEVQPKPLTPGQISAGLGMPWIPTEIVEEFAADVLEMNVSISRHGATNTWKVAMASASAGGWGRRSKKAPGAQSLRSTTSEWGTAERGANEILDAVLNQRPIKITAVTVDKKTVVDPAATARVNEIADKMRSAFRSWVWTDAERAGELLELYNKKYNNLAPRRFDGSHLTLPGIATKYRLHAHQKRAIWRMIQTGNTYLAHAVGAGKTLEMIAAGMEMRRLGLISKPLYVVPNDQLSQWAAEFMDAYPMANIMVADEENFHTKNRRRFMAQAAMNAPDAIIITQSALGKLRMQAESVAPIKERMLADLRDALEEARDDEAPRHLIAKMEKMVEQAEQRFDSIVEDGKGDNLLTFEDLGVDFLFVDEAHAFRKLDFTTVQQVKGIDPTGSRKALDLYLKTNWLGHQRPGRSHVFASGTPVTNTMGELYNVMRFFAEEQMERDEIGHFDAWAAMFGQTAVDYELNAAGRYEPVTRFAKFNNLPELMKRVRSFMDVLTSSNLSAFVKRPDVKGGGPENVVAPASEALKSYQETVLQPRMEAARKWKPSKEQPGNPDPIINIITDGRLSSIDMRYVLPGSKNDPNSKLNRVIDEIIRVHKLTKDNAYREKDGRPSPLKGAAQVVFYNHGFGQNVAKNRGFDARAWINQRLKAAGIPASEVAWFDEHNTGAKQLAVLKDVREGRKRIIIGHARALGVGKNLQNRLYALHYIDPPWYPADVEQPHGRIIRQGNQHDEVVIQWYATKGSYDSTMWQMVGRKGRFIEQAFMGDDSLRSMEDLSEVSQYEMARALSSGDERIIKLVGLQAEVERLSRLKEAHYQAQAQMRNDRNSTQWYIETYKKQIAKLKEAEKVIGGYVSSVNMDGRVGKSVYTKPGEFGEAVVAGFNRAMEEIRGEKLDDSNPSVSRQYGSIKGLPLVAEMRIDPLGKKRGRNLIQVTELVEQEIDELALYPAGTDGAGLARRIVNRLNDVATSRSKQEANLQEQEDKLKVFNKKMGAPFEHEQEFNEKIAELAQLQAELTAEGEKTPEAKPESEPPKFSAKQRSVGVRALSDVEFEAVFARVTARSKNRDGFVVVPTARALPPRILAEIEKQGNKPEDIDGVFHRGKVYIVREHISSVERLEEILFHEWHGHAGLYAMMGNDGDALHKKMLELYAAIKPGELARLGRKYKFNLMRYAKALREAKYDDDTRHAILMEEMLTHLTREYSQGDIAAKVREIVGMIRDWLRKNGFAKLAEMGEADIAFLLKRARAYAEAGAWAKDGAAITLNGQEILARLREVGITDEMITKLLAGTSRFTERGTETWPETENAKFALRDKAAAVKTFSAKLTPDKNGLPYAILTGKVLPERMKSAIGSVLSNPHYSSQKSKYRTTAYELALERSANANEIKHEVMAKDGDYEGLEGVRDHYRKASKAEREMIDKLLVEGDIQGKEFSDADLASGKNPLGQAVPEVVKRAYLAFRQTLEQATATMFDRLGRLRLLPYEESPFYQELIDLLDENLSLVEVAKRFGIEQKAVDAYLRIRADQKKLDDLTKPYRDQAWYSTLRDALRKGLSGVEMQQAFGTTPDLMKAYFDIQKGGPVLIVTAEKHKAAQWYKVLVDLLTVGDDHPMLQKLELYNAYQGVKEYDSQLAKLKDQWRQAKGYLPRIRKDGEQHVKVFRLNDDGTYTEVWMQPAKTVYGAGQLRERVAANLQEYIPHSFDPDASYEVVVEPNTATPEEIFLGIGSHRAIEALLSKVFDKATDAGIIENQLAVQQQVLRILADEISARGFGRHRLARAEHLIEGYETANTPAILSQFVGGMAGWLSKSEFAMRANKLMSKIPATRPEDKTWVREYVDDALKNSTWLDQWFGTARSFAALMYLGFKASSAILNATQNYVWGQAKLSTYTKGATAKLLKAQHDVIKDHLLVKAGQQGILNEEERWVLEEGLRRGRSQANYVRAMSGLDDNGGVLGKGQAGIRWLTEKAMIPFQMVETHWNREPALLAAYRVFRAQGMEKDAALKKAERFVDDVHFVVSKENVPALLRKMGPLGRTLYTFQSYTHNYLLGMLTSLGKGEFGVVARSMTALVLFGGLAALPFGDDLDKWYRRMFGERPLRMLDKWLRATAGQYTDFGDQIADFVLHGAPALGGVNFSNAIAVSVPWLDPEADTLAERFTGVWGGMAQKVTYAGMAAGKGDLYRTVEFMSPEALANILRAYRHYADGATTLSGRPVFGSDARQVKYTAGEGVIRAFGFMPLEPSKQTRNRWDARRAKDFWQERKADVLAKFRTAKTPEARRAVMQEVKQFNRELRNAPGGVLVPPINLQSLRQALSAKPDKRELAYLR